MRKLVQNNRDRTTVSTTSREIAVNRNMKGFYEPGGRETEQSDTKKEAELD